MAYHLPGSLMAFLADVPDPRDPSGKRHPLVAMLAHACYAILCGRRGYAAISLWGRDQPIELMHQLGYRRTPASFGTFQALFSRLDAPALGGPPPPHGPAPPPRPPPPPGLLRPLPAPLPPPRRPRPGGRVGPLGRAPARPQGRRRPGGRLAGRQVAPRQPLAPRRRRP